MSSAIARQTKALWRSPEAIMDHVGATVMTQVATTSTTSSAPGSSTIPTPSEVVVSGKDISSETSVQFIITDSDDDSNDAPQIVSGDEVTPPKPSVQPSVPKLILKRKLKKKVTKAQEEDQAAVKALKLKRKKKATATKSSAKAEKLVVRLPRGELQLPFSQQLQTMAEKTDQATQPLVKHLARLTIAAATLKVKVTPLVHPPLGTRQPRSHFHSKSNFKIFIYTAFLV